MLADVQKSPARKGESSKFDCQSPESRASLFFPYNLSANVRRRAPRVLAGAQRHEAREPNSQPGRRSWPHAAPKA